jgi:DNA invertase Pin-like site-specific DNA recombinase
MVAVVGSGESVIGYVRVSTDEQGLSGAGLDAQRVSIEAESQRRGWTLLRIEEDVLSGKSLRRPGLQRALEACRDGEASGVIVAKLDRLSRSLIDFAALLAQAQAEGWNVVALDLGVDLSTPSGEFLANVMASAAHWERQIIGQRTKDALAVRRSQGVRLGRPSSTPVEVVARIQSMRNDGLTLQAICDALNAEGVSTPRGGVHWRPSSLRSILASSLSHVPAQKPRSAIEHL